MPTPLKNALEKYGPLKPLPQTPHLEEDLEEVLRSEASIELIMEDNARPKKQKRKPGGWQSPVKKVRKSLALWMKMGSWWYSYCLRLCLCAEYGTQGLKHARHALCH
jgi:hypothetical protein